MGFKLNPTTGKLDLVGSSNGNFLPTTGGTLTGDVTFPNTGLILKDANNIRWRLTVGTDGTLLTTAITEGAIGSPWLFLFGTI